MTGPSASVDHSDDINLFEVLQTIWDSKIFVAAATLVAIALGVIVGQIMPDKFRLSVPFQSNYHSLEADYLCLGARNRPLCKQQVDLTSKREFSQFDIKTNKLQLKQSLGSKKEVENLIVELDKHIVNHSKRIFEDATDRLAYVKTLNSTDTPSDTLLREDMRLNFLMRQYQSGLSFAKLGEAEIKNSRLGSHYIVLIFAILGLVVSGLAVLIMHSFRDWKSKQTS